MGRQTDRPTVSDRGRDRDGERVKEESYLKIIDCLVPTRLFAIWLEYCLSCHITNLIFI